MHNDSHPMNFWRWFDPRNRSMSTWAFILNRITALGLTVYLFLHLFILGKLAQGAEAYDSFLELAHTPLVQAGEMLVIAGALIHGLNGLRIAMTSFNIGSQYQKPIFAGLMVIAIIGIIVFGWKMFLG